MAFCQELCRHTKDKWARTPFILARWQRRDIVEPLFGTVVWDPEWESYVRRYQIAWIEVARKNGKLLRLSTPIPTPDGWTTMGELAGGDVVFAPDGTPTRVVWAGEPEVRPSFVVRFADGAELVAGPEHEWTVNDRHTGTRRVVTTAELAGTLTYGARGDRRYTVDIPGPIECPTAELPVPPWLLGYWLGNGTTAAGTLTVGGWRGECDLDAVTTQLTELGEWFHVSAGSRPMRSTVGVHGLTHRLRQLGVLGDKHIPQRYLFASIQQRRALLAGLVDADGTATSTAKVPRIEYSSSDKRLAHDVLALVRSLGWKATVRERATASGRRGYRVCFTAYADQAPFTLARKNRTLPRRPDRRPRSRTNAIVAIEPTGLVEPMRCITVDHPDHCYLAGESFIPTHNSELLAFIALYLLVADGVEGAEIYGCAMDRQQAAKVFDVAARMVRLSPVLSGRLVVKDHIKRIIDDRTGSYYEVVAADAAGNLGHNPHGVVFDEVLTQRDSSLWDAMRTGMGTRAQPLIVAATTAGDDPASFARSEHDECVRIIDDPERARHRFAYIRNVPEDADPWDERNWPLANPALGDFLSIRALRQEATEAKNDPSKENAFRQYRLNQWVQQSHRWMPMHLYRRCTGTTATTPEWLRGELAGRRAYAGLDVASKLDLTAWALLIPDGVDGVASMLWRFWLPQAAVEVLDKRTNGRVSRWADAGWITVTPGDVIDYDVIYADIAADCHTFRVLAAGYDEWSGEPVRQAIQKRTRLDMAPIPQTFRGMTYGMTELMALTKSAGWRHHGNPVAEWCFDTVEVRHPPGDADQLRPDKPDRNQVGKRIDAVPTAAMAITRWRELAAKHAKGRGLVVRG